MKLDLRKIDYKNYEKIDFDEDDMQYFEQDISRAYDYLIKTHKLDINEKIVLRTLRTRGSEREKLSEEHKIDNYEDFRDFVIKVKSYKKCMYDIYYSIFNLSIIKMDEFHKECPNKMLANSNTVSSVSYLEADFDGITYQDYLHIKEEFQIRGIETIDKWSGHGIHIIVLLSENCKDEDILKKWIITLQQVGLEPDPACKDAARIMRLPFFNNTKTKYKEITRSEIICDTNKRYKLEDVFQMFGQDYNNLKIDDENTYRKSEKKKIIQKVDKDENEESLLSLENLNKYYEMDLNIYPIGIREMLRGLRCGYSNLQVFFLTVYFKKYFDVETIKEIIQKLEDINGNTWNSWKAVDQIDRFIKYDAISKFDLYQLQYKFGKLYIPKENEVVINKEIFKYDSKEIQLYLGFKYRKIYSCKSQDLMNLTHIKKSSVYNSIGNLIKKRNGIYLLDETKINSKNEGYIVLDANDLEKLVYSLKPDELKIYLYLKFRQQNQTSIHIKQESIAEDTNFNRETVSKHLKSLQKQQLITIDKGYFLRKVEKRISDTYVVY